MKKLILLVVLVLATSFTVQAQENVSQSEDAKVGDVVPYSEQEYQALVTRLGKENDCIFIRTIESWTDIDRRHLIIYAPTRKRPYLVKVSPSTFNLKFGQELGIFSRSDGRLCPYGGDALLFEDEKLFIYGIAKLTEEQAKRLIAYRNQDKK
ncbi:DUF6491 family protein [Luteithermobacter gelatinilyticus]|uniref:DUF6491 family protein n=1 Tax=Luteithermobacter gelatinilyticus TaxID=2582913 RepID=UPI001106B9D0|nr:DUF6491 family protein [Luteithermobacter gelatinilyticus]